MVKVKVCGMTRVADAELACDLGASAVGFVFWPGSPRCVTPALAADVVRHLPADVAAVGVFVNAGPSYLDEVTAEVGLTAVQLHGDEGTEVCRARTARVIKAVGVTGSESVDPALAWPDDVTVLLDVHDPRRRGGTGETVDWGTAAAIARRRRVFLAGGLTAENVAEAVASVRPYGVDVSSGVEASPGVKDPDRLRAFFGALS